VSGCHPGYKFGGGG